MPPFSRTSDLILSRSYAAFMYNNAKKVVEPFGYVRIVLYFCNQDERSLELGKTCGNM